MNIAVQAPPPSMPDIIEAAHAQHVRPASLHWTDALKEVRANPADPDKAIVSAILALEDMASAAKDTAATLRRELALVMEHDGTLGFETEHFAVTRKQAARLVEITDPKALAARHPDLMVPQDDKPDRAEIGKRLRANQTIAGAVLTNGGPSVLMIRSKGT